MSYLDRPAFTLGLTGDYHLADDVVAMARRQFEALLRFLFTGEGHLELFPPDAGHETNPATEGWPKLRNTPLIVLSSLTPGASSLAAEVALELKGKGLPVSAKAVVPYPLPPPDKQERLLKEILEQNPVNSDSQRFGFTAPLTEDTTSAVAGASTVAPAVDETSKGERRKLAADEYVAAYCDVLINIRSGARNASTEENTPAKQTVRAKLHGLTPGLLPHSMGFSWTPSGPVLHLEFERPENGPLRSKWRMEFPPQPKFDGESGQERAHLWREWSQERLAAQLSRLEDFNACTNPKPLLVRASPNQSEFTNETLPEENTSEEVDSRNPSYIRELDQCDLPNAPQGFFGPILSDETKMPRKYAEILEPVTRLRTKSSAASINISEKKTNRTNAILFWSTLLSATLLHCFAHWHPHEPSSGETVRLWILAVSLVPGVFALYFYGRFRRGGDESRDHDYRAMAEGLRLQFFWAVSGIDQSVAANYMQRQRSEMDWIRRAISSMAAPYQRWQVWFGQLSPLVQVELLREVTKRWVQGQREYFSKSYERDEKRKDFWHKLGAVLALGGIVLAMLGWPSREFFFEHQHWIFGIAGGLAVVLVIFIFGESCRIYPPLAEKQKKASAASGGVAWIHLQCIWTAVWEATQVAVRKAVPLPPEVERPTWGQLICTFFWYFPVALAIAFEFATLSIVLGVRPYLSGGGLDRDNWMIVGIGFLLLAGAMCVAWAERKLYAEHARQYNTMASLFAAAHERLVGHLQNLDELVGNAGKNNATDDRLFQEEVRHVQSLLESLGKEALDENAEWLILHRARPLEPVFAG